MDAHKTNALTGIMDSETPEGSMMHLPQNPKSIFNSNQKPKPHNLPLSVVAAASSID